MQANQTKTKNIKTRNICDRLSRSEHIQKYIFK